MNVDEHDTYPWLVREKQFLRRVIDRGVPVLGVCLGGQLICAVLGGQVTKNRQKEIGWFPVTLTSAAADRRSSRVFRNRFRPFIGTATPSRYRRARSAWPRAIGCDNQAFQYGRHVVALQFHWDYSRRSVETMIRHCGAEPDRRGAQYPGPGHGIQQPAEMLAHPERFGEIQVLLYEFLDALAEGKE